jgi:hypothetical protein
MACLENTISQPSLDFAPICIPLTSKEVSKQHGMTMDSGIKPIHIVYLNECKTTLIYDKPPLPPTKKIKCLKKKYFSISFIHLICKARQSLSTLNNQCHCPHLHSQCLHLPHTHFLYSLPFHCHSTAYQNQFH